MRATRNGCFFWTLLTTKEKIVEFRIADTFTDSLCRLTGDEQKAVKTTAFDLQLNPAHPSLQLERLKFDSRAWSVRVTRNFRAVARRYDDDWLWFWIGSHEEYNKRF